jgi:hypothetical protein
MNTFGIQPEDIITAIIIIFTVIVIKIHFNKKLYGKELPVLEKTKTPEGKTKSTINAKKLIIWLVFILIIWAAIRTFVAIA